MFPDRLARPGARSGSVLLIVVSLISVMLVLFAVVVRQVNSESKAAGDVVADAQARMMLPAALCFILEGARLGPHVDGETYGWTDVRHHLHPDYHGGADLTVGPKTRTEALQALPSVDPDHGNLDAGNAWPQPGSRYRADMHLWRRPPGAIQPIATPAPVTFPGEWLDEYYGADPADRANTVIGGMLDPAAISHGDPPGFGPFGSLPCPHADVAPGTVPEIEGVKCCFCFYLGGDVRSQMPCLNGTGVRDHWNRVLGTLVQRTVGEGTSAPGFLATQPVADTLADFTAGDPAVRPGSAGRAWFRLYRETPADHNGDGSPFYDRMALSGHGVFIVTCGAGASRGYRDWAEVTGAGGAALFGGNTAEGKALFEEVRAQERILWYRVEWSGFTGGVGDSSRRYFNDFWQNSALGYMIGNIASGAIDHRMCTDYSHANTEIRDGTIDLRLNPIPMNHFGTIKWIERLEREPPQW